jgi:hypothetical protein
LRQGIGQSRAGAIERDPLTSGSAGVNLRLELARDRKRGCQCDPVRSAMPKFLQWYRIGSHWMR